MIASSMILCLYEYKSKYTAIKQLTSTTHMQCVKMCSDFLTEGLHMLARCPACICNHHFSLFLELGNILSEKLAWLLFADLCNFK